MTLRKCVFWPRSAADSIGLTYRASGAKRAEQSIADSSTEFQKAIERCSEVMSTERFHAPLLYPRAGVRGLRDREENVLGTMGKGVNVPMSGLDYERAVLAAAPIDITQAATDIVVPYVHER